MTQIFVLLDIQKGQEVAVLHDAEFRGTDPGHPFSLGRTVNKHLKDSTEFESFRLDLKTLDLAKGWSPFDFFKRLAKVRLRSAPQ